MQAFRQLLTHRHYAVLICVATLLLRLLIPTGYMVNDNHGQISVSVCSGTAPRAITIDIPGMHGDMADHGKEKHHGKAEMPCAFSGLSAAVLGAINPVQLASLIAFVLAVSISRMSVPAPSRLEYLRPPLRGPPNFL